MTTATTTKGTTRSGLPYWAVTWGPGLTQTAIADTAEEAASLVVKASSKVSDSLRCQACGLAFSFVFGIQYHKVDCTMGLADDRTSRERRQDREAALAAYSVQA